MARYRAYILDWELYHGVSCDAGEPTLAPGIWAVAMNTKRFQTYELEAEGLEDVFYVLNMEHPEDYRMRSLSVGDVVYDLDEKKAYVCGSVGWFEIDPSAVGIS